MKKSLSLITVLIFSSLANAGSTGVYNCDMNDFYETGTLVNVTIRQSWGELLTAQLTLADSGGVADTTFRGVMAPIEKGLTDVLKASHSYYQELAAEGGIDERQEDYELTLNYEKTIYDGKEIKDRITSIKLKSTYDSTHVTIREIPCVEVPSTNYKGKH